MVQLLLDKGADDNAQSELNGNFAMKVLRAAAYYGKGRVQERAVDSHKACSL